MKPLSRRQLEVLRAVRALQATHSPTPDATVSYEEITSACGNRGLYATMSALVRAGLVDRVEKAECLGDYQWTRTLYRAIPAEDVA